MNALVRNFLFWFYRIRPRIIKWPRKTLCITINNYFIDNWWAIKYGWKQDELIGNEATCEKLVKLLQEEHGYRIANAAPHTGAVAPAVAPSVQALDGGFDPCCGQQPKVTEWRLGCYGAQCMECGGIVGDERQLDRTELMAEWNRVMRKRTANVPVDGRGASPRTVRPDVGGEVAL